MCVWRGENAVCMHVWGEELKAWNEKKDASCFKVHFYVYMYMEGRKGDIE